MQENLKSSSGGCVCFKVLANTYNRLTGQSHDSCHTLTSSFATQPIKILVPELLVPVDS